MRDKKQKLAKKRNKSKQLRLQAANEMALAVHYSACELDTVTGSVTRDAKCAKMRKYRPREELGSSAEVTTEPSVYFQSELQNACRKSAMDLENP